ncbi:MAG: hypothetical protein ACE5HM_06900 [Acidiferrobacterales bacterium]
MITETGNIVVDVVCRCSAIVENIVYAWPMVGGLAADGNLGSWSTRHV